MNLAQNPVSQYLPIELRQFIEAKFYAKINEQASIENLLKDQSFCEGPKIHVGLYSDHGVVHVRDVATNILEVLDNIHGVLIPHRDRARLEFMKGYGALLAYLHDIGMMDFSAFGRSIHPEYATHMMYQTDFDEFIDFVWAQNIGNISWRLKNLHEEGALQGDLKTMLREMLGLAFCHSKSKCPVSLLNSPAQLQNRAQYILANSLETLFHNCDGDTVPYPATGVVPPEIGRFYRDLYVEGFAWLKGEDALLKELIEDVIDTLRALRAADALRKRGTVLKTSGGYQIFIDQKSATAIFALQKATGETYMLEVDSPLSSGEANIASSELSSTGDLQISFNRGYFYSRESTARAVRDAAIIVVDIHNDVITSFDRAQANLGDFSVYESQIMLENTNDNPDFCEQLIIHLAETHPEIAGKCFAGPSLKNIPGVERERYLHAANFEASHSEKIEILKKIHQTGHNTEGADPDMAFQQTRILKLRSGEHLVEGGEKPGFVYVTMGAGLMGFPMGGYEPFEVRAWTLLGTFGVIRGGVRAATLLAGQDIKLLIIPKEIYLKYWHHTYSIDAIRQAMNIEVS